MRITEKIPSDGDYGELKRGSVKGIQGKKKSNQNWNTKHLVTWILRNLFDCSKVYGTQGHSSSRQTPWRPPSEGLMEEFESPGQQEAAEGY